MKTLILFLCAICCAVLFFFIGRNESSSSNLAYQRKIDSLQGVAKKLEGQLDTYKSAITFTSVPNDSASIMKYVREFSSGPKRNLLISNVNGAYLADVARSLPKTGEVKTLTAFYVQDNLNLTPAQIFFDNQDAICGCGIGPVPPKLIFPSLNADRIQDLLQGVQ